MWWAKQSNGFRGWFSVKLDNGTLRTGLINSDFTITVRAPGDDDGYIAVVYESVKSGVYYFDISSGFITTNGTGEYGVIIEVDTSGTSGSPNVIDVKSEILKVSQQDLDSLVGSVWDQLTANHLGTGTFGRKLGKDVLTLSKFLGLK